MAVLVEDPNEEADEQERQKKMSRGDRRRQRYWNPHGPVMTRICLHSSTTVLVSCQHFDSQSAKCSVNTRTCAGPAPDLGPRPSVNAAQAYTLH